MAGLSTERVDKLLALWDQHIATEFTEKSAASAVSTMIEGATVNHVPVMTGGVGKAALLHFYGTHFIPRMPSDTEITPLCRTVGVDAQGVETVTDEFVFSFTHTVTMDWMLPGVPPTGRHISVPFVVIVKFSGDLLAAERIYWDQATVLQQAGLLPTTGVLATLVPGAEQARKAKDLDAVPSNGLVKAASATAGAHGAVTGIAVSAVANGAH